MFEYCLLNIRVCVGMTDTNIMEMYVLFDHFCVYMCSLLKQGVIM